MASATASQSSKRLHSDDTSPSLPTAVVKKTRPSVSGKLDIMSDNTIDALAELHVIIQEQKAAIDQLRSTVEQQQTHIEFLMSIVGISAGVTSTEPQAAASRDDGQPAASSQSHSSAQSSQPKLSYSKVLGSSPAAAALTRHIKTAVVSAVYRDLDDKARRARNIIVNGLPSTSDDKAAVLHLVNVEFGLQPNVIKCRRLGKPRPDRVQPLLVVFEQESTADYVIRHAKELRQSSDDTVKSTVYINADITEAEALAAYQKRCEKRQRSASQKHSHQHQNSTTTTTATAAAAAASQLLASAPVFVPSTSASLATGATAAAENAVTDDSPPDNIDNNTD